MKLQKLATDLMFGMVIVAELGSKYGVQFRKNKTAVDIIKAQQKAAKNGFGKVEFELSMLELYLKDILKKVTPCSIPSAPTSPESKPNLGV